MEQLQALKELAKKVETGDNKSIVEIENNAAIDAFPQHWTFVVRAAHGSIDAAHALHKAVLGDRWDVNHLDQASRLAGSPWGCELSHHNGPDPSKNMDAYSGHNFDGNPARAWLLAIIKAKIAELEE